MKTRPEDKGRLIGAIASFVLLFYFLIYGIMAKSVWLIGGSLFMIVFLSAGIFPSKSK